MPRLITEWSTETEGPLADTLRMIAAEPEHSTLRMELEAALHGWQAAWLNQQIGVRKQNEREQRARADRRAVRLAAKEARGPVSGV